MKKLLYILIVIVFVSCGKVENRIIGSWFVTHLENDTPVTDYTMTFNEDGKGIVDGENEFSWTVSKKTLSIKFESEEKGTDWENTRNKKNEQYFIFTDSLDNLYRMEMDRIKE